MRIIRRHAVTLVEMLVTFAVVGVILIGLGSLYGGAAADFAVTARTRERRFSREHLESELTWRFKAVPPDCLMDQGQLDARRITFTDEKGAVVARDVLAYDYVVNDTRINAIMPAEGPVPVNLNGTVISNRIQIISGIIFQRQTSVFMIQRPITTAVPSFRAMPAYQAFVDDAANLATARLLAIGIDELDFDIETIPTLPPPGRRVRWTIRQN